MLLNNSENKPLMLMLDDDLFVRNLYVPQLVGEFNVLVAEDFRGALDLARRYNRHIGVVLSDTEGYENANGPVSGIEIFKSFADSHLLRPSVCVFGMSTDPSYIHEWHEAGAYLFLPKLGAEGRIMSAIGGRDVQDLGTFLIRHYHEFVERVRTSRQLRGLQNGLKLFGNNGEVNWSEVNV